MKKGKRKAQAAKARAFYARRQANRIAMASASYGGDVLPPDEAKAMAPWKGCGIVAAVVVIIVVLGWAVEKLF